MKTINKGSIVKYGNGWRRVTVVFKDSVNLCPMFSSKVSDKRVPLNQVTEDSKGFFAEWEQSESYKCM